MGTKGIASLFSISKLPAVKSELLQDVPFDVPELLAFDVNYEDLNAIDESKKKFSTLVRPHFVLKQTLMEDV